MIELFFVGIVIILLLYAGKYDMKNKLVETWVVALLLCFGCLYWLLGNMSFMDSVGVFFFTIFIWGLPTLFGFGIGDLLIFISLAFFIPNIQSMWVFYAIFLLYWICWTLWMLFKERKRMSLKLFVKNDYPLVPVIAVSFIVWVMIGGLSIA